MLSGLVVGLAVSEEENFPQEAGQADVSMQDYMSQPRLTNNHRDGQYGDCTLNIDYDEFNFSNTTTTVTMNCNARYGGGRAAANLKAWNI